MTGLLVVVFLAGIGLGYACGHDDGRRFAQREQRRSRWYGAGVRLSGKGRELLRKEGLL